ncbi:MAG: hypothetical protein B6245_03640 [Desulfobacteraceae bacterium 4572_88]|nr:MAG: hypothetical protein B6245_03640 [Desulfobacteraceae bacterium 4572_88]
MIYLVCLLEEPSAQEMLKGVLPRILPEDVYVQYVVFEGKQDLEKQIEHRLRGWQKPESVFLIMRDQDSGDCMAVKQNLLNKVMASGRQDATIIRIACHELESFYLGDLEAVETGLAISGLGKRQKKKKYKFPDSLSNAAEELFKITGKRYQKVAGSRAIGPHLKTNGSNQSNSFNVLLDGIKKLAGGNP